MFERENDMFTPITNKIVVVTGASKGIGRGIAKRFAEVGARLLVINRNKNDGESLVNELRLNGCTAYSYTADVSDEKAMLNAAEFAKEKCGQIDVLCVNAGIYPCKKIEELSLSDWDLVNDINLKGTFLTVKSFLPLLKNAEYGRIIFTSSITGPITGFPGWSHYGATKAGQLGFMRSLALELAPEQITVNSILPGNIMTESVEAMGEDHVEQMARWIPQKKLGHVNDIANAALFLASKEAGFITGQTLVIDGGQVLQEAL